MEQQLDHHILLHGTTPVLPADRVVLVPPSPFCVLVVTVLDWWQPRSKTRAETLLLPSVLADLNSVELTTAVLYS